MALYFGYRINKNVLLQTVFLAILPTGKYVLVFCLLILYSLSIFILTLVETIKLFQNA